MNNNDRLEDLTKVFDRTWKANHSDDVKNAREKEKKFMDRMFNVKRNSMDNKNLTPEDRVNNLNNNMNNMRNFNNQNMMNNIRGKFN